MSNIVIHQDRSFVVSFLTTQLQKELLETTSFKPNIHLDNLCNNFTDYLNCSKFQKKHILLGVSCKKVLQDFKKGFERFFLKNGLGACYDIQDPARGFSETNADKNIQVIADNLKNEPAPMIKESETKSHLLSRTIVLFVNNPLQANYDAISSDFRKPGECSILFVSVITDEVLAEDLRKIFRDENWYPVRPLTTIKSYCSKRIQLVDMTLALMPYNHQEIEFVIEKCIIDAVKKQLPGCENIKVDKQILYSTNFGYLQSFDKIRLVIESLCQVNICALMRDHLNGSLPQKIEFKYKKPHHGYLIVDNGTVTGDVFDFCETYMVDHKMMNINYEWNNIGTMTNENHVQEIRRDTATMTHLYPHIDGRETTDAVLAKFKEIVNYSGTDTLITYNQNDKTIVVTWSNGVRENISKNFAYIIASAMNHLHGRIVVVEEEAKQNKRELVENKREIVEIKSEIKQIKYNRQRKYIREKVGSITSNDKLYRIRYFDKLQKKWREKKVGKTIYVNKEYISKLAITLGVKKWYIKQWIK